MNINLLLDFLMAINRQSSGVKFIDYDITVTWENGNC